MSISRSIVALGALAAALGGCYVIPAGPVTVAPPPTYAPGRWVWTGSAWIWQPAGPAPAPGSAAPSPPPPASSSPSTGSSGASAPAPPTTAQNCQTVIVEGHAETRVMPDGQRVTVWIPSQRQQVCQ